MDGAKRQIPIVIDTACNEPIFVETLSKIYEQHELQHIRHNNREQRRFVCQRCRQLVILHATRDDESRHGHTYYFQHPEGVVCEWKSDAKSRAEIYHGIAEGRHHFNMKHLLADTLVKLEGWEIIDVDKKFVFSPDEFHRAKPDVHAKYLGKDVVFEIQLRSESPQVIVGRKLFYEHKGWPLVWLSVENDILGLRGSELDRIKTKQVQKDIAFLNRGNWFLFNDKLADDSLKKGKLCLQAKVWQCEIVKQKLDFSWKDYNITFDTLSLGAGEAYYIDFYKLYESLRLQLASRGKRAVMDDIEAHFSEPFREWDIFLYSAKLCWPSLDMQDDLPWLHKVFKDEYSRRELQVKALIVDCARLSTSYESEQLGYQRWERLTSRLQERDFGLTTNSPLWILAKLLLILGFDMNESVGRKQRFYIRTVHDFYDYERFRPYQHVCYKAIENSPLRDEILANESVIKRLNDPALKTTVHNTELDRWLDWFLSAPKYRCYSK